MIPGTARSASRTTRRLLRAFARRDEGVALVEFGFALPIMVLLFGASIEGARTLLAYHGAISGVRDAARYVARAVPSDICDPAVNVPAYLDDLTDMVRHGAKKATVFPADVTIGTVTLDFTCFSGTYRTDPAAVVTLTAPVSMTLPFSGVFTLWGQPAPQFDVVVRDQARVFGS